MDDSSRVDPTVRAMKHILELDIEVFEHLLETLTAYSLPRSGRDLEKQVSAAVPELEDQVESIVGFATAFAGALSQIVDKAGFINSVVKRAEHEFGAENSEILEERLHALFEAPAIAFVGGGGVSIRENTNFIMRTQVNTDLRPIPMPAGLPSMRHFAVLHRLRLHYAENLSSDSERIMELVLDYEDLKELKENVTAAIDAQEALQNSISEMGGFIYAAQDTKESNSE